MKNEELHKLKQSAIKSLNEALYHLQEGGDVSQAFSNCLSAGKDLGIFLTSVRVEAVKVRDADTLYPKSLPRRQYRSTGLKQSVRRRGLTKRALDAAYCRCPKEIRIWHDGGCRNCGKPIPPRK